MGSGPGEISHYIHDERSCQVVGVDIDSRMTEYAQREYRDPGLSFQTLNIEVMYVILETKYPQFYALPTAS